MLNNNNSWRTLKFILLGFGLVFVAFLVAYTASNNWYFGPPEPEPLPYTLDTTTDAISGLQNIEIISPTGIARLTVHPGITYTRETKAEYDAGSSDYGLYLTSPSGVEKYLRLANSANGGYGNLDPTTGVASGTAMSRIFDSTVAGSSWTDIAWTDKRAETAETTAALTATISALYHFNTAPGITADSSTYANTLTNNLAVLSGVLPTDTNGEGLYNQSVYFNGTTAYMTRASGPASLNFGQDSFSVECWIKTSTANQAVIIGKRGTPVDSSLGWELGLNSDGGSAGKPYLAIIMQDWDSELSVAANYLQYLSAGKAINDDKWHHIVAYREVDRIAIYVDGIFQNRAYLDNPAGSVDTAAQMVVGRAAEAAQYYTGKIDELILYKNRVLTESEILSRYERGLGVKFQVRASNTVTSSWTDSSPAWSADIINSSLAPSVNPGITGQYFQYRAILESRNRGAMPMLKTVVISGPASPADKTDDGNQAVEFDPEQIYTNPWGTSRRNMTQYQTDYITVKSRTDLTAARGGSESGLTALWRLENNTNDSSTDGVNNQATLVNSPVYSTTVVALTPFNTLSIQLNGTTQYLTAAHNANIAFKYDHTAEMWIYPTIALDATGLPTQLAPSMTLLDKDGYKLWWDNKSGSFLYELQDVTGKGSWQKDNVFKYASANLQSATPFFSELVETILAYRGKLYVGVSGNAAGDARIYVYDGLGWSLAYSPGGTYTRVPCMTVCYDRLYCGLGSATAGDGDLAVFDGANWSISASPGTYEGIFSLVTWNNAGTEYLYAGTGYSNNSDSDMFYINSAGTWTQVVNGMGGDDSTESLYVFNNKLYIGTGLDTDEAILYRWDTPPTALVVPAAVYDPSVTEQLNCLTSIVGYNGKIYVGFAGNASGEADYAVSSSGDSGTWTLYKYNQIGGIGTFEGIYTMFTYAGKLYAGLGTAAGDCQLWYTTDGVNWTRDDDLYNMASGYRTLKCAGEYMGRLYLGFGSALYNATSSVAITSGEPYDLFYYQPKGLIASKTKTFNANTWYHIQAVYDRSINRKLYLNIFNTSGLIESQSAQANFIMNSSSNPLFIGADRQYGRYFKGLIDEVSLFNKAYIGYHQDQTYYTSGEITAPNNGYVRWDNISWAERERYGDELTAEAGTEMAGLWHLNNNYVDEFGGTTDTANTLCSFTSDAKFGAYSGWFNGFNNKVVIQDNSAYAWTSAGLTVEAWIKSSTILPQTIVAKGAGTTLEFRFYIESDNRPACWVSVDGSGKSSVAYGPSARTVSDDNWHHVVGVYDGTAIKVFVDGESGDPVNCSGTIYNGSDALWIGSDQEGEWYFNGQIDEVAVYRRPLQSNEILSRYQKGITSLKLRVSVKDGGGYGSWVGPYNNDGTYFTIGSNEAISGTSGLVGRAIKYRAYFETANPLYPPRFDLLKLTHQSYYSNQSPWVRIADTKGWAYSGLAGFIETRGSSSATGDNIRYQISHPDYPTTNKWYWYNTGTPAWEEATSSAMSSTATTVNANIYTFNPDGSGQTGNFYFKSFLVSNGIEYVSLDQIKVSDQAVEVTYPNGSEAWSLGEERQFSWSKKGAVSTVKIELSRNGLIGSWEEITSTVDASLGVYTWTVTAPVSTTCYARITSLQDSNVWDVSNNQFEIKEVSSKSITVEAPISGEELIVDVPYSISWTSLGAVGNVTLQYSKSGLFDDTITLASNEANDGNYFWTPQSTDISSSGKIRIYESDDGSPLDDSANFTVRCGFTIQSPNTAISWTVGTNQTISWNTKGESGYVRLEYSRDDFNSDINIIVSSITNSSGAGSYIWSIPVTTTLAAAYNVKVRIKTIDVGVPYAEDKSDTGFKIGGKITVGQPNGGETLYVSDLGNVITWTKVGGIINFQIKYSTDGGTTWPGNISASTTGNDLGGGIRGFLWEPIPDAISPNCRVKITDADDGPYFEVLDTSNSNFAIKGKLALTTHPGQVAGQEYVVNQTTAISWTTTGTISDVNVWYRDDSGSVKIAGPISNTGGIIWTIPDDLNPDPNSNVRVWVENVTDTTVKSESNNPFKIKGAVTVDNPIGGDTYLAYDSSFQPTTYSITWTVTGSVPFVKLEYSTTGENGSYSTVVPPNPVLVACGAPGTYSYNWQVPGVLSNNCRIKIADSADPNVYGKSQPTDFKIRGKLEVTQPLSSDEWQVGDTNRIIKFKVTGNIGDVNIEYLDNSAVWQLITTTGTTAGIENSYQWSSGVADVITSTAKIRISPVLDRADAAESQQFKIKAKITAGRPALNESVYVYNTPYQATTYPITWTYTGTVTNVKLQYSANGDAGPWVDIKDTTTNGDGTGSYSWQVPDVITSTAKVKIIDIDTGHPAAEGKSSQFLIKGKLIVGSPTSGDAVTYQDSKSITWTAVGTFSPVKIEYSTNNGSDWVTPEITLNASNISGTSNSYSWSVPDKVSSTSKIRISSTDWQNISAESGTFKIKGKLQVGKPAGGEIYVVGEAPTISGTKSTAVTNIKIEYYNDGVIPGWENIITNYALAPTTTWSYNGWTVPDKISANPLAPAAKIRVTDVTDAGINDVISTSNSFKVIGGFAVTYPITGTVWGVQELRPITWTTNGSVGLVNVDWSINGITWTNLATSYPNNGNGTTALTITVPDSITNTFRMRITASNDNTVTAYSPIIEIKGRLQLTQPTASTKWRVGDSESIIWNVYGAISAVNIDYWNQPLGLWESITTSVPATNTPGAGSYAWVIPNLIRDDLKIRIIQTSDNSVSSESAEFKIRGKIQVNNPNGSEVYYPYDVTYQPVRYPITYTITGSISQVRLEYSRNGTGGPWNVITTTSIGAAGVYNYMWEVPGALADICKTIRVQVIDSNYSDTSDYSDANLEVRGSLNVTTPNGSSVWGVGETNRTIYWTGIGNIGDVTLQYYKGITWYDITTVTSINGINSYLWAAGVFDAISTGAKIRVKPDPAFDRANTAESAAFSIKSNITAGSPTATETLYVDNTYQITYTYTGTVSKIKIEYNINDEVTWTAIATANTNGDGTGSYDWQVPNAISSNVNLRFSDADAGHPAGAVEGSTFNIKGKLTVGSPTSTSEWTVDDSRTITWTANGGPFNVKIELYNGTSWEGTPIVASYGSVSGTNSYTWNPVWDRNSSQCKVRITSTDWQNISVESGVFKIKGKVQIGYPAGG
ncbi:MAG: LamG-like jellyroll fold domain-containing protein, partial [Candidatus Brocadiia bacterium]